ncbi:MAG: hypothetical protein ABJA83_03695 [Burkholderiaceae bacterium]
MNTERNKGGGDDPIDVDVMRRYRQASATLDERPSAAASAAILAAAAREIKAKPRDAAATYPRRSNWPLAAAAAVMLSTLAVMLAIRTNEEMPSFTSPEKPAGRVAENVAPALPPASRAVEEAPTEVQSRIESRKDSPSIAYDKIAPAQRRRQGPVEAKVPSPPAERRQQAAPSSTPSPMRQESAAGAAAPATSAPAPAPPLAQPVTPSAEPPQSAEKSLAKARLGAAQADSASSQAGSLDRGTTESRRESARNVAPAPSAATERERDDLVEPAAVWLERIIRLRREGRHNEADMELKRFRERYPQVQPPLEALPRTGTQ